MASNRGRVQPSPGDLIEIFRPGYQHWALYVGDGYVIHVVRPCEKSGAAKGSLGSITRAKAKIQKEALNVVVDGDSYCINNQLDNKYKPLPVGNIIRAAERQVGRTIPYDLISHNCEHWVNNMRYGRRESRQIRGVVQKMDIVVETAFATAIGAAAVVGAVGTAAIGTLIFTGAIINKVNSK
ncbi:hypothetical protein Pmani_010350 [Petrolisthes manimaculis]|uniref:LRAT domain-containing protein n=1 Tax=Petrolisthes manimaculis TaxID=1843537 RepID=A0AAE1Q2X3_9EUCA|nr:hypothetical protein Pmani_010350 [Petrolisthes manimaculis]